jgi:pre-mRNA-processing factor 40
LVQRAADEARRAERKRRHRMDDFRYALKKVQRIDIEMTYEEVSLNLFINLKYPERRAATDY